MVVKPTCWACWASGFAIGQHPAVPRFACWAPSEPTCSCSVMPVCEHPVATLAIACFT